MNSDFWIFGYGSLMWNPGFPYEEAQPALLRGFHRAFCVYSVSHRGTPDCPGLVLGLDRGGACRGRVYRVAAADVDDVAAYLDDRERRYTVYQWRTIPAATPAGRVVARTFTVDRTDRHYCGKLPEARLVDLILQGHGERGACVDYLFNTVDHLDEMGLAEGPLHRLRDAVKERLATPPEAPVHTRRAG